MVCNTLPAGRPAGCKKGSEGGSLWIGLGKAEAGGGGAEFSTSRVQGRCAAIMPAARTFIDQELIHPGGPRIWIGPLEELCHLISQNARGIRTILVGRMMSLSAKALQGCKESVETPGQAKQRSRNQGGKLTKSWGGGETGAGNFNRGLRGFSRMGKRH
jgi:hypothetical protein